MRPVALMILLCLTGLPAAGQATATSHTAAGGAITDGYELVIDKSREELLVKQGSQIVRRYRAATGRGGQGTKRIQGDKKTPVGVYRVVKFKSDSQFHFFMHLDYPNLLDAWYGYKNEVIDASEFQSITSAVKNNKIPPQDTALGGYIGIHGIGDMTTEKLLIHEGQNWTAGCIAVTNEEIMDLKQYVDIGTKIVIRE